MAFPDEPDVICPNCKGELTKRAHVLTCGGCGKDWPIEGGVPVLTESSTWYPKEHMTREQFEGFLRDVDLDGWERAIETAVGGMNVTETIEGRERYPVSLRYPADLRDSLERSGCTRLPPAGLVLTGGAAQLELGVYDASCEQGGYFLLRQAVLAQHLSRVLSGPRCRAAQTGRRAGQVHWRAH